MHVKEVGMVVALAIITALFFGLFVDAIYEAPKYETYCNETIARPLYTEKFNATEQERLNNYNQQCNNEFQEVNDKYNRNLFFILAPVGIILIVWGVYLTHEIIGSGFLFGGILTLIYATVRTFSGLSKIWRVIIVFVELVLLILITLKKLNTKKKK